MTLLVSLKAKYEGFRYEFHIFLPSLWYIGESLHAVHVSLVSLQCYLNI